jgi:hypothetical protein
MTRARLAGYATQAGVPVGRYEPTGPQRRRIAHKQRHRGAAPARLAVSEAGRRARIDAAEQTRRLELFGLRYPLRRAGEKLAG